MAANDVLYGFVQLADQFGERISQIGEQSVAAAIGLTVERHNADINRMIRMFASPTEDYQIRYSGLGVGELQPLDENGVPHPVKISTYDVGFPLAMAGSAIGWNFVTGAKMTVGKMNDLVANVLMQDIRYVRRRILTALMQNASFTYPDPIHGNITVQGLANGDTVQYALNGGDTLDDDTHYLFQAAAIDDSNNPFTTIETELLEHPDNAGPVIAFIPTNLKTAVEALADYIPVSDPDVRAGAFTDVLTGALRVDYPGTAIGKVGRVWIVEWTPLPDGYIVAVAAGGVRPLGMRQDPEPELRGLTLYGVDEKTPFYQRNWMRRIGFGGLNRTAAAVMLVGAGAYAIPTGYTGTLG
jgi:hypothetical protein